MSPNRPPFRRRAQSARRILKIAAIYDTRPLAPGTPVLLTSNTDAATRPAARGQLPRPPSATAPTRTRARRQNGQSAAQSNPKSTSYHHRGNHFGLTKRASRKRPNPCRNPISAGPASSLYVSCGPCSSVPASGCHHRPVPDDRTGSPEQALNLLLLAVSPSGTRKTMTKSHALRSQAVAPTTWNPKARPSLPRCHQSSNHPPTEKEPTFHDNFPPPNRPPAARGTAPVTAISTPIKERQ